MRRLLIVVALCLQLVTTQLRAPGSFALDPIGGGVKIHWSFVIEVCGRTKVSLTATNIAQSEITFDVPKSYEDLRITPTLNSTIKPFLGHSCDELKIQCKNVDQLNLSYVWPDGAVQYKGTFYFAGQEKPYVAHGEVTIRLPENCSVFWIEGYNDFTGNVTDELTFKIDSNQPVPSFSYSFAGVPQPDMSSTTSEHVTLHYHRIMEGKPWIDKTIEIVEEQWSWLKNTLNGTLNHVNVTFAPYGYNDLGTKFWGFCYYNSRNVEILATEQFGVGIDGWVTSTLFHELAHAFTPLFEDLPSFFSEGIAETVAYDTLKRTSLNKSADFCRECRFQDAYRYGVERGLLNYTWFWKWNNTIYDNRTKMDCCYGVSTFVVDYIIWNWGYSAVNKVNEVFNKAEIESLEERQRLFKFIQYLSTACNENISHVFSCLATLITQWNNANHMRRQEYKIEVIGPFTLYIITMLNTLVKDANDEYKNRNYYLSINKFTEAKNLMNSSFWTSLDLLFWIMLIFMGSVLLWIRRVRNRSDY